MLSSDCCDEFHSHEAILDVHETAFFLGNIQYRIVFCKAHLLKIKWVLLYLVRNSLIF